MPTEVKCERCNGRGIERWENWREADPLTNVAGWHLTYVGQKPVMSRVCPSCLGHGIEKPRHLVPRIRAS
jgi:hypothetical protein